MKTTDTQLSAADARKINFIETALLITKEAIGEKFEQCEQSAAEVAEDKDQDNGKPIMAKLTLTFTWPAGAQVSKIEMDATHSVRRTLSFTAVADGNQAKLNLAE